MANPLTDAIEKMKDEAQTSSERFYPSPWLHYCFSKGNRQTTGYDVYTIPYPDAALKHCFQIIFVYRDGDFLLIPGWQVFGPLATDGDFERVAKLAVEATIKDLNLPRKKPRSHKAGSPVIE